MAGKSNIQIEIAASVQQAVNGISSVVQKLDAMSKQTGFVQSKFGQLTAGVTLAISSLSAVAQAVDRVVEAAKACVTAYSAQEQAERRLQTVLTATRNAVGMSSAELLDLAESLSKVTAYSDQEIIAVEAVLVATRKISRDVMPEATKAVLDMAAATGDDAAGAAKDLAQALSDPAGEIESLKEKGIQLTIEQAENIKKVQEQNGLYEAQKILLEEVAGTYGNMAKAIAETDTGKLTKIKDVWEDIKEGLGEGLLNTISPALDTIYRQLCNISDWINGSNALDAAMGFSPNLSEYSSESLRQARDNANEWMDKWGDRWLTDPNAIRDYERAISNITAELQARGAEGSPIEWWKEESANEKPSGTPSNGSGMDYLPAPRVHITPSWTPIPGFEDYVYKPGTDLAGRDNLFSALRIASMLDSETTSNSSGSNSSAVSDFLSANGSLSTSYQIQSIQNRINEAQSLRWNTEYGSDEYNQIMEIIGALEQEKKALMDVGKESKETAKNVAESFQEALPSIVDQLSSINDSFVSIMENMADSAADKLQEIRDKWDEYFEDLDEKQGRQADSLNALLASGNMSYEDYIDAMNEMDKERAEAEEEAAKEEEEQQKKANELGKAAFTAKQVNSVAEASINAALGITDIWSKYSSNPAIAGVLTGLSVAATAAQIAAISSQQYTPMAAGGITEGPTRTLLGEGNPHELVMPLTEGNLERFGIGPNPQSGVINLTINIGTVYSKEELSEEIFNGIERAQRTGALPNWRYA